jgi:hypothetical protein
VRQTVPAIRIAAAMAAVWFALAWPGGSLSFAESAAELTVSNVRVGVRAGVTRIVIDLSGPAEFILDTSGDGRVVIVVVPGIKWQEGAISSGRFPGAVGSMEVVGDGGLAIRARAPVYVRNSFALPPKDGKGDRIVIDLVGMPN